MENKKLIIVVFLLFILSIILPIPESNEELNNKVDFLNEKVGVYSYLFEPNTTTINTAEEFQQIRGLFNNTILEYFYFCEENNSIVYNNSHERFLVVHWSANLKADRNNVELKIGLSKNEDVFNCSFQKKYLKFSGEYESLSGFCVGYFKPGDEIKLVVTTNSAGDVIETSDFYIYINNFYNT